MTAVETLRKAADAMTAEADHLDALDAAATAAPWKVEISRDGRLSVMGGEKAWDDVITPGAVHCGSYCYGGTSVVDVTEGDLDLIVHRRDTVTRDAATLRALAAVCAAWAGMGELDPDLLNRVGGDEALTVARAFLGEPS